MGLMIQAAMKDRRDNGPSAAMLDDGQRLHLHYGPIDLIIEAFGASVDVLRAYEQARTAFAPVLGDLVGELDMLRRPIGANVDEPSGTVAKRMWAAARPYAQEFITPMVAVAGSVADHILAALVDGNDLERAYVNNGGDIALYLQHGSFRVGICDNPETGEKGGTVDIHAGDGIGGIATSGWRGRSFSLGIADAVTVLAGSAAKADAAATMIANGVDLPASDKIVRQAAREILPDSDLGSRLVTVDVGVLSVGEIEMALEAGAKKAQDYFDQGLFSAAYLSLAQERMIVPQDMTATKQIKAINR